MSTLRQVRLELLNAPKARDVLRAIEELNAAGEFASNSCVCFARDISQMLPDDPVLQAFADEKIDMDYARRTVRKLLSPLRIDDTLSSTIQTLMSGYEDDSVNAHRYPRTLAALERRDSVRPRFAPRRRGPEPIDPQLYLRAIIAGAGRPNAATLLGAAEMLDRLKVEATCICFPGDRTTASRADILSWLAQHEALADALPRSARYETLALDMALAKHLTSLQSDKGMLNYPKTAQVLSRFDEVVAPGVEWIPYELYRALAPTAEANS